MSNFQATSNAGLQVLHLTGNSLDQAAIDTLSSLASQGRELVIFAAPTGQKLDPAKLAKLADPITLANNETENDSMNFKSGQLIKSKF